MQPRDLVINERLSQPRCPWRGICTLAGLLAFLALLSAPQHSDRPSSTLQSISLTVPAGLRPAGTHLGSDDDVAVLAPVKTAPHGTPPLSRLPQSRPPPKAQLSPPPSAFPPPAPATATPVALVQQPLPNCSVLFFHHLEKTAGTTLRSVLQRHAQLGLFDFVSFVNRYNKVQFQMVTHRVDEALRTPGGLSGLRLAVEIHIGGGGYEQFLKYTLPDLLLLRSKLRAAGCRCNLVTLLRHPLLQHLSWHRHFVNERVPLCFWNSPHDCQSRMSMALACHGGPSVRPLTRDHRTAVQAMWDAFDLVGMTEHFDSFLVLLADLAGLQRPFYRIQLGTAETTAAREATRRWSARTCASLTADPPQALLEYIRKRMAATAKAAAGFRARKGKGDSRGPAGMMDCAGYGPCELPAGSTTQYSWFERDQCDAVTAEAVLSRLCGRIASDEPLYLAARERFEQRRRAAGVSLPQRVELLRAEGAALEERAMRQQAERPSDLAAAAGARLQRAYRMSSGGGVPWVVDEHASWYKPHERARYSCVNCSGDVVPEKDLVGCWPLWPQFGPDELEFRCVRRWTSDPGEQAPHKYMQGRAPLPCWRTCWTPLKSPGAERCTAACPSAESAEPAVEWRARWDAELHSFKERDGTARDVERATGFIRRLPNSDFFWSVY